MPLIPYPANELIHCSEGDQSDEAIVNKYLGELGDLLLNKYCFKQVLPFFPTNYTEDPVLDFTENGLLLDGHTSFKYAADDIVDFHAIKIVTSNAKQVSKIFQICFGFKEIAHKGLETGSEFIGAHVLRNGNVTIELVNNLVTIKDNQEFAIENYVTLKLDDHSPWGIQFLKQLIADYCNEMTAIDDSKSYSSKIRLSSCKNCHEADDIGQEFNSRIVQLLRPINKDDFSYEEAHLFQNFLGTHSDGVIDISFFVKDIAYCFARAAIAGATIIRPPTVISDKYGIVKIATIKVPNTDILHTLIEDVNYVGPYLPNYRYCSTAPESIGFHLIAHNGKLPSISLANIDHCVENYSWDQSLAQAKFYANAFGFHKFWAVDEEDISTVNSSLISIVMASANGKVKLPLNEPAKGIMRGQIEEFYDYNEGAGIQHIAFKTTDIITTVRSLKSRGVEFNLMSKPYYENLMRRMVEDGVQIKEDINELMELNILVDYTKLKTGTCNYILQIFTKPLHDRPTLFFEIIQRHHHDGFGKGTFKGLYESIEAQQILRGTLVPSKRFQQVDKKDK